MKQFIPLAEKHTENLLTRFPFMGRPLDDKMTMGVASAFIALVSFLCGMYLIDKGCYDGMEILPLISYFIVAISVFMAISNFLGIRVLKDANTYYSLKLYFHSIDYKVVDFYKDGKRQVNGDLYSIIFDTTPQSVGDNDSIKNKTSEISTNKVESKNDNSFPYLYLINIRPPSPADKEFLFFKNMNFSDDEPEIEFLLKFWTQSTLYVYFLENGSRIALAEESEERARRFVASV